MPASPDLLPRWTHTSNPAVTDAHNHTSADEAPDALLLIAPGCPHCPVVLDGLATLVKEAVIGRLEVVNIAVQPDRAAALGVRSVPWARIGPFDLEGLRSVEELRRWAKQAGSEQGMAVYFNELLKSGQLQKVEDRVREQPEYLHVLPGLLGDQETSINTRIGIMAVFEGLEGSGLGASIVNQLGALTTSTDARVRNDACYALSLTESANALPFLQACLADPDSQVREVAQEAIEALEDQ